MRVIDVASLMPLVNLAYAAAAVMIVLLIIFLTIRDNRRFTAQLLRGFGRMPENREIDPASINDYLLFLRRSKPAREIDGVTWNDLDMDKIYMRINACYSSVGEEYLYAALHRPLFDAEKLERREALIQWLDRHPAERLLLIRFLAVLGKQPFHGAAMFMEKERLSGMAAHRKLYITMSFLPFVGILATLLLKTWIGIAFAAAAVFVNIAIYLKRKLFLDTQAVSLRYATSILLCAKAIADADRLSGLPERDSLRAHVSKFRGLVKGMRASYLAARCSVEFQSIIDAWRIITLSDAVKFNRYVRAIAADADGFQALFSLIGEWDACLSILSYRKSLGEPYCQPLLSGENTLIATAVYHPLLQTPVPNSIHLNCGAIITGSNASGKSTFLKAIAINAILALTIHTCHAASFRLKPALTVTSMALRDDIQLGQSYFMAEIRALKRMTDLIGQGPCLCFIDEILRGTNDEERRAASRAILEYMAQKACLCLVATHDTLLAKSFAASYRVFHFDESVSGDGKITFDYRLYPGVSEHKNAIAMMEALGMEPALVQAARRYAASS